MKYAPEDCISSLQESIATIDQILDMPKPVSDAFKALFGLRDLENDDFADVLRFPLGYWQAKNWDPSSEFRCCWVISKAKRAVGSDAFQQFCDALTAGGAGSSNGLVKM